MGNFISLFKEKVRSLNLFYLKVAWSYFRLLAQLVHEILLSIERSEWERKSFDITFSIWMVRLSASTNS